MHQVQVEVVATYMLESNMSSPWIPMDLDVYACKFLSP